jgi:hypothetical protein
MNVNFGNTDPTRQIPSVDGIDPLLSKKETERAASTASSSTPSTSRKEEVVPKLTELKFESFEKVIEYEKEYAQIAASVNTVYIKRVPAGAILPGCLVPFDCTGPKNEKSPNKNIVFVRRGTDSQKRNLSQGLDKDTKAPLEPKNEQDNSKKATATPTEAIRTQEVIPQNFTSAPLNHMFLNDHVTVLFPTDKATTPTSSTSPQLSPVYPARTTTSLAAASPAAVPSASTTTTTSVSTESAAAIPAAAPARPKSPPPSPPSSDTEAKSSDTEAKEVHSKATPHKTSRLHKLWNSFYSWLTNTWLYKKIF